jgi:hypothetical protein
LQKRGKKKRGTTHTHFQHCEKERIQARWVALHNALPFGFNQIRGEEKHKAVERNNKTKNDLKGKDAPLP